MTTPKLHFDINQDLEATQSQGECQNSKLVDTTSNDQPSEKGKIKNYC